MSLLQENIGKITIYPTQPPELLNISTGIMEYKKEI